MHRLGSSTVETVEAVENRHRGCVTLDAGAFAVIVVIGRALATVLISSGVPENTQRLAGTHVNTRSTSTDQSKMPTALIKDIVTGTYAHEDWIEDVKNVMFKDSAEASGASS